MDNENKILGKKRLSDNKITEEIENNSGNQAQNKSNNNIIKDNLNIIPQLKDHINSLQNNIKNNALSLNDSKNNSAFVINNSYGISNPNINHQNMNSLFSFGNQSSFNNNNNNKEIEKNISENPYPQCSVQYNIYSQIFINKILISEKCFAKFRNF